MGNFKIKSIWETKNTGGAVSPDLQNKVNQNETKINTIEQKYVKKDEANTFTAANTFNAGNNLLTYTSTNTTKPDGEVLTRKDMKYVRVVNSTGNFTINGNNSYQSAQFEINGLTTGLNEFYVVFTTTSVDIGFDVAIQVNNLNYPNLSDIKIITTSNLTTSNVDQLGFIYVGFTIYGNNKFRWRGKNTHTSNITFNGFRVYKRVPSKISDN